MTFQTKLCGALVLVGLAVAAFTALFTFGIHQADPVQINVMIPKPGPCDPGEAVISDGSTVYCFQMREGKAELLGVNPIAADGTITGRVDPTDVHREQFHRLFPIPQYSGAVISTQTLPVFLDNSTVIFTYVEVVGDRAVLVSAVMLDQHNQQEPMLIDDDLLAIFAEALEEKAKPDHSKQIPEFIASRRFQELT